MNLIVASTCWHGQAAIMLDALPGQACQTTAHTLLSELTGLAVERDPLCIQQASTYHDIKQYKTQDLA